MANIGILGAGTWGMALARMIFRTGHATTVWSALPQEVDELSTTRKHRNLPGMVIPDGIVFTKNMEEAIQNKDVVLFAVPSVFVRSTAEKAAPYLEENAVVVDVAKGLEAGTLLTMTEVIASAVQKPLRLVALSGPTHAEEVAVDLPTCIVAASADEAAALYVQELFMNTCLRVYTNRDIRGVELCGAMKNVMALAAGISSGLGYGDNAKAALITRGMAEITRLGLAAGCEAGTFGGLAGIGDLIVTATSVHSRNNRCGQLIGQGVEPHEAVKQVGMVVEGVNALPAAMEMQKTYGVEMPLATAVNAVVNEGADPREAVKCLMVRPGRAE